MSRDQGFIRRLLGMAEDKREDAVEAKMEEACAALLESEEFTRAADLYTRTADLVPDPGGKPLATRYLDAIRRQLK